jgi:hypothetical protein
MPEMRANNLAKALRAMSGPQQGNLLKSVADELDRLSAFECAFFSMMEILRAYAKANGELDAARRSAKQHVKN